jgi:SulP family sulfate permease
LRVEIENMGISDTFERPHFLRLGHIFDQLRGDFNGGLTAAVVALPLALAFAVASGVEPKAGIYTAIIAGIVAAICGGCPVQISGPTGAMAVILVGIVAKYGIEKVWIAGLMAGLIQIASRIALVGKALYAGHNSQWLVFSRK